MPAESTEMWSEYSSTKRGANRGWQVVGAETDEEARNATPLDGRPIPVINDAHPENSRLFCRDLSVGNGGGPNIRIVRATYEIPGSGGFNDPGDPEPKLIPEWGTTNEPFDRDASPEKRPVLNTAGFAFEDKPTKEISDLDFTFVRRELVYPWAKAMSVAEGATNINNGQPLPMIGFTVARGQLLVFPPQVPEGFIANSGFVTVIYPFRVRQDGWRTRILNQGYMGWYSGPGGVKFPGPFVDGSRNVTSEPVLLKVDGTPFNAAFKVMAFDGLPRAPVASPFTALPDEYIEETGLAVFLKYLRYVEVNLAGFFT